ncbi:MAG: helicase-related protein [Thermomicrobiales bacterium]
MVLPAAEQNVVRLRPLTGSEADAIGVYLPLERPVPSAFTPPDPRTAGDAAGGRLLLDAARLALRDGAAPFRSLGRLSVTPRPYQFVPLIMALRQDPVRLLVADDVGVGKTIEAGMIARELLDRGIAKRLAVICPAHLCEQWEQELREKFGIEAAVIQPSRFARLERDLPRQDMSVFRYHRHLIASIDYVKSGNQRGHFIENAPDLVIVDEAHIAARPRSDGGRVNHQRYDFLRELAADQNRHLILVSATPHSGIEESFRSLLGLLDPAFDSDGAGPTDELERQQLVPHVVQRRRHDLSHWPGGDTPFPDRQSTERRYSLAAPYHVLFDDVLDYCRETIQGAAEGRSQQQRVRHWAAIALLRCVLSSPRAASSVLSARADRQGAKIEERYASADEADAVYRPQVSDHVDESEQAADFLPTAPLEDVDELIGDSERRRLRDFLRRAKELEGPAADRKLAEAATIAGELLRDGFQPIIFCRFIATANYLAEWLPKVRDAGLKSARVIAVTGEVGDQERRARIAELVDEPGPRILVATDCLSEGINLQEHFNAVVHYDLPWNPNRLEQREGRVDRFGQTKPEVRVVLLAGADNPVDAVVLDVLIRKARTIREQLGISVPVPADTEQVVQTVVENVLLSRPASMGGGRGSQMRMGFAGGGTQLSLGLSGPEVSRLHEGMDAAAAKADAQRRFFDQRGIKPDEVTKELEATDPVLGDSAAVERFLGNAAQRFGGELRAARRGDAFDLLPGQLGHELGERGFKESPLRVTFDRLKEPNAIYLGRTHPIVATFANEVLGRAFAAEPDARFARCGAIFTDAVRIRTVLLLLRLRYLLRETGDEFAEEVAVAGFEPRGGQPAWLEPWDAAASHLLDHVRPIANMSQAERSEQVSWALGLLERTEGWHRPVVTWRVDQLQQGHARLRKLVKAKPLKVEPHEPPDILGCYVLVPAGGPR